MGSKCGCVVSDQARRELEDAETKGTLCVACAKEQGEIVSLTQSSEEQLKVMKTHDASVAVATSRKRERDEKEKLDEPVTKRPKLDAPDVMKTTENSLVYRSLFAQKEQERPVTGENGDFMTRCAKWGLQ